MASVSILTSDRLILRPLALADVDRIQMLFPHWEIVQHLAAVVPWPYPSDGALTYVRDVALPAMERGNEWYWAICLRNLPEELIGIINLADSKRDNEFENRGFWLGLEWQGQGLMSEAVAATSHFWFNTLGRPVLRVQKAAANAASRRISLRSGMRLIGTGEKDFVSGRLPVETWEQTAEEWRACFV